MTPETDAGAHSATASMCAFAESGRDLAGMTADAQGRLHAHGTSSCVAMSRSP